MSPIDTVAPDDATASFTLIHGRHLLRSFHGLIVDGGAIKGTSVRLAKYPFPRNVTRRTGIW